MGAGRGHRFGLGGMAHYEAWQRRRLIEENAGLSVVEASQW